MRFDVETETGSLSFTVPTVMRGIPTTPIVHVHSGRYTSMNIKLGPEDDWDQEATDWFNSSIFNCDTVRTNATNNKTVIYPAQA